MVPKQSLTELLGMVRGTVEIPEPDVQPDELPPHTPHVIQYSTIDQLLYHTWSIFRKRVGPIEASVPLTTVAKWLGISAPDLVSIVMHVVALWRAIKDAKSKQGD
jgi:hypothetical protein